MDVTIPNPDNTFESPIYEGADALAHLSLTPGRYSGTDLITDEPITLVVGETRAYAVHA